MEKQRQRIQRLSCPSAQLLNHSYYRPASRLICVRIPIDIRKELNKSIVTKLQARSRLRGIGKSGHNVHLHRRIHSRYTATASNSSRFQASCSVLAAEAGLDRGIQRSHHTESAAQKRVTLVPAHLLALTGSGLSNINARFSLTHCTQISPPPLSPVRLHCLCRLLLHALR
ncbi:hypothetical protein P280DRAFT_295813 [Massarina eburnea CBS 473.64]|uniref:Uncharacterized protein n=1 Tax=Massarina eburnea CBS 473.64 TaxID=1395130 RepID=A0A6A6S2X2_9PLEO|nr:hypothetical protein P280DRAFT_295813 [Massarina eburnea CBS 473.64]